MIRLLTCECCGQEYAVGGVWPSSYCDTCGDRRIYRTSGVEVIPHPPCRPSWEDK